MSLSKILHVTEGEVINMTSALGDPSKDLQSNWPSTAFFETISTNVDGQGLASSVKQSIQLGLDPTNHVSSFKIHFSTLFSNFQICCSCNGDCATNDNCECLKMARLMKKTLGGEIILNGKSIDNPASKWKAMYWENPRFVCGPRCSCSKDCSLNAIQDIDKRQTEKFDIRRTDNKGFCLYAKLDFETGAPIASFNGELVGPKEVVKDMDVYQYSVQAVAHDDPFFKILSKSKSMDKEYKDQLKKAYRTSVYVNPLKKGNLARMANHSCDPNMEILRVFQGGVSPADLRVVLVATKAIKSGDELTWNYGSTYVAKHLGTCLCDKCKMERSSRKRKIEDSPSSSQAKKQCD
ncbi:hypothetical protein CAEBREN_22131 [Caenorhabditis brenneri]|uniref:SET domain-containing protein n=1 Tax=Caenorhabditis brenneri TaxID=135651 RepID=G0NDW7_CAEBE|nr:hypothetical protein CAEBREN_22131 [Caenorhabditis brenneri]